MSLFSLSNVLFTLAIFHRSAYTLVPSEFDLSLCDITKSCLKSSKTCSASSCLHAVTLTNNSSTAGYLEIELMGNVMSSTSGYIAIGFSKDSEMGDDSVIGCYRQSNGKLVIRPSYNNISPLRNYFLTQNEYTSDFILNEDTEPTRLGGAFDATTNQLYCRFRLKLIPTLTNSSRTFNLTSQPYYILLARGTSIGTVGFSKHVAGGTSVSQAALNFTAISKASLETGQSKNYGLVKAHGCFMILSWVLFASVGIFTARHMKGMCRDQRPGGQKVWFLIHVSCQALCCLCTAVGFVAIFSYVRGYSNSLEAPASAHPILGLITCGLAFVNPVIAAFRCHPEHPRRPIFNYVHFSVGSVAQILAVPSIALGLKLHHQDTSLYSFNSSTAILVVFVAFQLILDVSLWFMQGYAMKGKSTMESANICGFQWSDVKCAAAFIHTIFAVICAVILVVLIALT